MRYKVNITESAQKDLEDIYRYIRDELENLSSAETITNDIYKKCNSLTLFPKAPIQHKTPTGNKVYRAHSHNYTIIYSIKDSVVKIEAISYSRRNIENLL